MPVMGDLLGDPEGGLVYLTDVVERWGKYALVGHTARGESVAVQVPDMKLTVMMRAMLMSPRQTQLQALLESKQGALGPELINTVNELLVLRRARQAEIAQATKLPNALADLVWSHECSEHPGVEGQIADLLPVSDLFATKLPDEQREQFVLTRRHALKPFHAEVWPSACLPPGDLEACVRQCCQPTECETQVRLLRPFLGHGQPPDTVLEIRCDSSSSYWSLLRQFNKKPKFVTVGSSVVRLDLFHTDFPAELTFLAARGLRLNAGMRIHGASLVPQDARITTSCNAEVYAGGLTPQLEYQNDTSAVCYYHVAVDEETFSLIAAKHALRAISCIVRRGPKVELVVYTCDVNARLPDGLPPELVARRMIRKPDEAQVILAFLTDMCQHYDVDVFVSMCGLSEQMPYLAQRLEHLKVAIPQTLSRVRGAKVALDTQKRESAHSGDKNFLYLKIPGRDQLDLMPASRSLKLTVCNTFTVLAAFVSSEHKQRFPEGWRVIYEAFGEDFPGVTIAQLPFETASGTDTLLAGIWASVFYWLGEQNRRVIMEQRQISALSNTRLHDLVFKASFRRVMNLLFLNSFHGGQPEVLFSHAVELLRQNWPGCLTPEQREKAEQEQEESLFDKEEGIRIEGGFVEHPLQWLEAAVILLNDFASLYPSIIISGVDVPLAVRTRAEAWFLQQRGVEIVHTNPIYDKVRNEHVCLLFAQDLNLEPRHKLIGYSCSQLMKRRKALRAAQKDAAKAGNHELAALLEVQQLATKTMNNAMFGVMNLVYPAYSGSITWQGRTLEEQSKQFGCGLDAKYGMTSNGSVAYGDTDSVLVRGRLLTRQVRDALGLEDHEDWHAYDELKDPDVEAARMLRESDTVRRGYFKFDQDLVSRFNKTLRPPLELECDGIMVNFLSVGAKMYAGLLWKTADDQPVVKKQGLISVRRDRPKVLRDCVDDMADELCLRESYDGALQRFMRAVQGLKQRTLPFADLFMTREITAKAQAAGNNITAHVKKNFEVATGEKLSDGARMVYVAVARDRAAKSENFAHFSLAAKQGVSYLNMKWYLEELVNGCELMFGHVFGAGLLKRLAYGQDSLTQLLQVHTGATPSTKLQTQGKKSAKAEAKVKTQVSKERKEQQKRAHGEMASSMLAFVKPKKAKTEGTETE